jgi:hypothetical protein
MIDPLPQLPSSSAVRCHQNPSSKNQCMNTIVFNIIHFIFQSNIELLATRATVFWARTEAHNFHLLEPRNSFQELSSSRVQINLRGRTYSILPLCSAPKATCIMHPYFKPPEMSGGSPIDCYSIKLLSPLASTSSPELLHSSNKGSTQGLIFCCIQIDGSLPPFQSRRSPVTRSY